MIRLFRRVATLKQRMDEVDWALQRIGGGIAGASLAGWTSEAEPLPEAPGEFEWVHPHRSFDDAAPALHGQQLSYQRLTPEQMAYCLDHVDELQRWAAAMKALSDRWYDKQQRVRRAEWRARKRQERKRTEQYEADLQRELDARRKNS